ncbi:unnamed protein product, partial [Mesorhabditis spiculigera]
MLQFPALEKWLWGIKKRHVDDIVDVIHYYWTTRLLILLALLISAKQWVGKPIQCWVPKEFSGAWEQYIEDYCFVHATYFAPISIGGKLDPQLKEEAAVTYYQWVPIDLIVRALLFYIPFRLYRNMLWNAGGRVVETIVGVAISATQADNNTKEYNEKQDRKTYEAKIQRTADMLYTWVAHQPERQITWSTTCYMILKTLNLINVLLQLWSFAWMFGYDQSWALQAMSSIMEHNERSWASTGMFPRVVFCDTSIKNLGNVQSMTTQCVLMINLYNERIFLSLWLLFGVMSVVSVINYAMTAYQLFWPSCYVHNSRRLIDRACFNDDSTGDRHTYYGIEKEWLSKLGKDYTFTMRLIENHTGEHVAADIHRAVLFKLHNEKRGKFRENLAAACTVGPIPDKKPIEVDNYPV